MALYLISYDINEKDAFEYQPIYDLLQIWKAKRILYSEWILVSQVGQAEYIYGELAQLIQPKDRLLVQEVMKDAYWDKLMISDDEFRNLVVMNARG